MGRLDELAASMKAAGRQREGHAIRRELSRGLRLEYSHAGGVANLTLSRPATWPSEQEVAICRGAFEVPADAIQDAEAGEVVLQWPLM